MMAAERKRSPELEEFIAKAQWLLENSPKYRYKREKPRYKEGDRVRVTGDTFNSYISRVIGPGRVGTVAESSDIPLVIFGDDEYYVYQGKLRPEKGRRSGVIDKKQRTEKI